MNLIDEKHVVFFKRSEQSSKVAGLVKHRTAGHLETHAQFVSYDVAQRSFSQTRRAMEQDVVKCFTAHTRRSNENTQIVDDFFLTGEITKPLWSQCAFKVLVGLQPFIPYVEFFFHSNLFCKISANRAQ